MKRNLIILVLSLMVFNGLKSNAQCAMCKATVEGQVDKVAAERRAKGLNDGILYMMVIPYLLFGAVAWFWYNESKKERQKREKIEEALTKTFPESFNN